MLGQFRVQSISETLPPVAPGAARGRDAPAPIFVMVLVAEPGGDVIGSLQIKRKQRPPETVGSVVEIDVPGDVRPGKPK